MLTRGFALSAAVVVLVTVVPTATADIVIPVSAVTGIATDAASTAGTLRTPAGATAYDAQVAMQRGADATLASLGRLAGGTDPSVSDAMLTSAIDGANAGNGFAGTAATAAFGLETRSADTATSASVGTTGGAVHTATRSVHAAGGGASTTGDTASTQYDQAGQAAQSTAASAGAAQGAAVQGSRSAYRESVAPTTCIVMGVAADLTGVVNARQVCNIVLG